MDKKRLQKLAGILKEEDKSSTELSLPASPGYYWFKDFDAKNSQWTIVLWNGYDLEFIASDAGGKIFNGTKEEYLSMSANERYHRGVGVLGIFVGPIEPPNLK